MDHRAFIRSLDRETLARLNTRSNLRGLLHLLGYVGAIALCALPIILKWPLWPLAMLPLGVLLTFLFTLEHEATHQTPFASKRLNEAVGHLCGLILVLPFTWFRYFHLAHHKYTNQPGKDPELGSAKPETRAQYVLHISGLPYWRSMLSTLFASALGRIDGTFIPERAQSRVTREARIMIAVYAVILGSLWTSSLALWLWIAPMILGQPFLRLYLLAEHGRCAFVANMFANTRTTLTNRLVRFIAWNMPYHAEHHAMPMVPFHHLPELHGMVRTHLYEVSDGYIAFTRDDVRALR